MTKIKIDFERVYGQGDKYNKHAEEFRNVKSELTSIKEGIEDAWKSEENVNFLALFQNHINYMDNFINFIDDKGNLLKKTSKKHEDSEKDFIKNMERCELKDEYRDRY